MPQERHQIARTSLFGRRRIETPMAEALFMNAALRIFAIIVIFVCTSIGWLILGGVTKSRNDDQSSSLRQNVAELWGQPQEQRAPTLTIERTQMRRVHRQEKVAGVVREITETVPETIRTPAKAAATDLQIKLGLDPRRKGLNWYALYDVQFKGVWHYRHDEEKPGNLRVGFSFPDQRAIYDDFRFFIDGEAQAITPENGNVDFVMPVEFGQEVVIRIGYNSRGMDQWSYLPSSGITSLSNFHAAMSVDFAEIDFPQFSMSPSTKAQTSDGWKLDWNFKQVVTGHKVGMVMPQRIQPGALASELSWSAPISLFFFFLVIFTLGVLKGVDIHPLNYAFLAGAFFAFHLLFAYLADHVAVTTAFSVASVTSIFLVVSYLRLVVSARFALVEAALAQLVYLVGFSLAHFWDGFTGLTVTGLSVLTLFLLMQLTGRIRWSEVLRKSRSTADGGLSDASGPAA